MQHVSTVPHWHDVKRCTFIVGVPLHGGVVCWLVVFGGGGGDGGVCTFCSIPVIFTALSKYQRVSL